MDDLFRSMQSRFAEMNALLEEARRAPDQVAAAKQVLATITALYAAVREEGEADYREALQFGDTTRAGAIRDLLREMDEGPGACIRSWRPSDPQDRG